MEYWKKLESYAAYAALYKESVNELNNELNSKVNNMHKHTLHDTVLNTQANFIAAVKCNAYIVGSVAADGTLSFSPNPAVHATTGAARAECTRLARLSPGKLYVFVQLSGGEMVPTIHTISI